jgi:hypothetical protein
MCADTLTMNLTCLYLELFERLQMPRTALKVVTISPPPPTHPPAQNLLCYHQHDLPAVVACPLPPHPPVLGLKWYALSRVLPPALVSPMGRGTPTGPPPTVTLSTPATQPKWGTLGRAQDRRSAARLNDVLGEEPFGPLPIKLK